MTKVCDARGTPTGCTNYTYEAASPFRLLSVVKPKGNTDFSVTYSPLKLTDGVGNQWTASGGGYTDPKGTSWSSA